MTVLFKHAIVYKSGTKKVEIKFYLDYFHTANEMTSL